MKKRLKELLEKVRDGRLTPGQALEELEGFPYCDLDFAKVDHFREVAKGAPEIVFGLGKTPAQIVRIAREILKKVGALLVTRVEPATWAKVRTKIPGAAYTEAARTITRIQAKPPAGRGTIVVMTAGTSDIPVAEEAAVTAEILGNAVDRIYDVGVAGLHRLLGQYERLGHRGDIEGHDGASFKGLAALLAMLNACPGGVAVVNIDNGFGAAFLASQINHI